jgi:Reverse transcriptase (RNA-dependent DNA polymerase)
MKLPKGFNGEDKGLSETKALKLNKSIYGLVQAAGQWNKRFEDEVFKLGFKKNNVDPCLFFKQEGDPFCVICLYVDDMIITGDEGMMNETIKGLEAAFKIKIQRNIKDFLGCEIIEGSGEIHLYQRRIIEKLVKKLAE